MSSVSGVNPTSLLEASYPSQNTTKARAQDATTGSTSSTSTPSGSSALTSSVGTTFINLLVKELQNQDPTAPVDSTAMVGQMISLNQLDQLISINQDLSGTPSSTSSTSGSSNASTSSAAVVAARTALANAGSSTTDDPLSSAASAASVLDLSGLTNSNIYGAK